MKKSVSLSGNAKNNAFKRQKYQSIQIQSIIGSDPMMNLAASVLYFSSLGQRPIAISQIVVISFWWENAFENNLPGAHGVLTRSVSWILRKARDCESKSAPKSPLLVRLRFLNGFGQQTNIEETGFLRTHVKEIQNTSLLVSLYAKKSAIWRHLTSQRKKKPIKFIPLEKSLAINREKCSTPSSLISAVF